MKIWLRPALLFCQELNILEARRQSKNQAADCRANGEAKSNGAAAHLFIKKNGISCEKYGRIYIVAIDDDSVGKVSFLYLITFDAGS